MQKLKFTAIVLLAGFVLTLPFQTTASASQVDVLIEKLVEKKILTRIEAETIRSEVETAEAKDHKANAKKLTPWIDGLSMKGDVRLRYEAFNREGEGVSDRNRYRYRVRWGIEKKFSDEWKAGFSVASGEGTTVATSTNTSLDGEFGLKSIFIDKAYAVYTPTKYWQEIIPSISHVEIGGGKVANPYEKWTTSIVWDGDVTPEGIYERVDFKIKDVGEEGGKWELNTLQGQFVVDEDSDLRPGDHGLLAYGVGTTYQWLKDHDFSFKVSYYDWQDYADFIRVNSVLGDNAGGNSFEVDDFKIVNLYGDLNFMMHTFWGVQPMRLFGDYAHNADVGPQSGRLTYASGDSNEDAFSLGVSMGKTKDPGSWQVGYEYLYIEPNAVVGNFSESDLGVGFANNKGHKLSWKYMLIKNLEVNSTLWLVNKVDTSRHIVTFGNAAFRTFDDDDFVTRFQLDLVYKF